MTARSPHQPGLDGLRTVAVSMVLAFHAGVGALGGGFVGVDLFFVLSGFLVAGVLLRELDADDGVRLWRFYARRVRRLLPAAVVVVVATAAAFVLVTSSVRRAPLVGDAQASLLYVANWRFLGEENDYFGADVDRSPYRHFWSLAIEEQLYLAFPLVLLALWRLSRRWTPALPVGIAVLAAASLTAQLGWAAHDPARAYYGTDARAYQLLAGVLLALHVRRRGARRTARVRPWTAYGLAALAALVVVGTAALDLTPSHRGLAATVASVALVHATTTLGDRGLGRALGARLPAYLGRISYGTYLWHWPVLLVVVELLDLGPVTLLAVVAVLSAALAALSFEVLEHPVRASRRLATAPFSTTALGLAASLVAALVVPQVLASERKPVVAADPPVAGAAGRAVPDVDWTAYATDQGPPDTLCSADDLDRCVVHEGSGPRIMLIGDSHARMLAPTLTALAEEHDFTLALDILVGCAWQREVVRPDDRLAGVCRANRDEVYDELLASMEIDVVVLAQKARDGAEYRREAGRRGLSPLEHDALTYASMADTLADVERAGAAAVMVEPMLVVPDDRPNPLECLAAARTTSACVVPVPLEPPSSTAFVTALATTTSAASITINDLMCPDAPLCQPLDGDVPVWFDRSHHTPAAIERHADEIWRRLEPALRRR